MTIIFFHGLGSSPKLVNYFYDSNNKKYNKNDFIKLLEKIDNVFIPEIPYTNIYYYSQYTIMKPMFHSVNKINIDDLSLDKFIKSLYKNIDKTKYKKPYTLIGHSHGIYYACEFAKQFKDSVKCIISLDGSWITNKLNKQRLKRWKEQNKLPFNISSQKTLDSIIDKIKNEKENEKYINMIFDFVRISHTKHCIKQNYEKLTLPFITFRDFNIDFENDTIAERHNTMVLDENKILNKNDNQIIYILLNATHELWLHNKYKNLIVKTIKLSLC